MITSITLNKHIFDIFHYFRIGLSFGSRERLKIGDRIFLDSECEVEKYGNFTFGQSIPFRMGAFSYSNSVTPVEWRIGRYCSIGRGVETMGPDHPLDRVTTSPLTFSLGLPSMASYFVDFDQTPYQPRRFRGKAATIFIGNDVWVGSGAIFSRGVTVGDGAIIAARSVVTKDVPADAIVAGVPARIVRMRHSDRLRDEIQASAWWRYWPDIIHKADPTKPEGFVERLHKLNLPLLDLPTLTGAKLIELASSDNNLRQDQRGCDKNNTHACF